MNKLPCGFVHTFEVVRGGEVIDRFSIKNIVPTEGLNAMLGYMFKAVSVPGSFYVGIFEGNYSPVPGDNAATFPGLATESTAYTESTRRPLVFGSVTSGSVDNVASRAEFTMNADKTIYGGFISSASAKSGTTGVLLSAVRFPSPKVLAVGDILRVTSAFTLISA